MVRVRDPETPVLGLFLYTTLDNKRVEINTPFRNKFTVTPLKSNGQNLVTKEPITNPFKLLPCKITEIY